MFQKLLANAVFSPGVANTIGFYIRRLQKEELTRRLGLIFMSLAVGLQSLALVSPPEPTIAAGPNNIIYGGITSVEDLLAKFDLNDDGNGHRDLQQIFAHYGIARSDLAGSKLTTIKSTDRNKSLRSIGRKAYAKSGEMRIPIAETGTEVYERYLWSWDTSAYSTYQVLQGTTGDGRWFAVLLNCGNLVVDEPPPAPQQPIGEVLANCESIKGWVYDPNEPRQSVTVVIFTRLENSPEFEKITQVANLPTPVAPQGGNHGFNVPVPAQWKSDTQRTVYTVIALDAAGGGDAIDLARTQTIQTPCRSPEPEPCPYDRTVGRNDSRCVECPYVSGITISDSRCIAPPTTVQPCEYNPTLPEDSTLCQPCLFDAGLWVNDPGCKEPFPLVVYAKSVRNITQGIEDANGTTVRNGDVIEYRLSAHNVGNAVSEDMLFEEDLSDILEYASIKDANGATLHQPSGVVSWGTFAIEPGQEIVKTVSITINPTISAAPSPINNPESNNLELRNVWYNKSAVIHVPIPTVKVPEILAATLPNTGPSLNVFVGLILIMLATYFYARNRQLSKELTIARIELSQAKGVL